MSMAYDFVHICPFDSCRDQGHCDDVQLPHQCDWLARHLDAHHPGWTVHDLKEMGLVR